MVSALVLALTFENTLLLLRLRVRLAEPRLVAFVNSQPMTKLPDSVAGFNVDFVVTHDDRVYVNTGSNWLLEGHGLVFAPTAEPRRLDLWVVWATFDHLYGPWWRFRRSVS